MDYILREIVKNSPDTHISELLQVADFMEALQQRLAEAEAENRRLKAAIKSCEFCKGTYVKEGGE